jgi:uncharacterized protein (TIGR03083 family)
MTTTEPTATLARSITPIGHSEGLRLFATELDRNLDVMRSLTAGQWNAPTECPAWDVRRMYLHVLGACESGASMRELAHQMLRARRYQKQHGGPQEAALSAVQVAERLDLAPAQLVTRFAAVAPAVVRRRTQLPAQVRRLRLGVDGPVVEKWSVGYLVDVIYLRDSWMHRIDVTRATESPLHLTAEHDGRIVADVVGEWARRHGRPFRLTLTGPAGGSFSSGDDGSIDGGVDAGTPIEIDAIDFCRTLAGREPGRGLMATIVPF